MLHVYTLNKDSFRHCKIKPERTKGCMKKKEKQIHFPKTGSNLRMVSRQPFSCIFLIYGILVKTQMSSSSIYLGFPFNSWSLYLFHSISDAAAKKRQTS